ncbi:MAG TPA: C1 family peptidase [Candidatus Thermoplasmatota archaeon]|nr:C1 family peptidase [Candidatus Thermoplasmatota archaeon]
MNTKIFSILLMGILLGTCCTVIGTQQQNDTITQPQTNKQNPTKEITAENECGCESYETPTDEGLYYRTGLLPAIEILPQGKTFTGRTASSWDWRDATYNGHTGDWTTPIRNQANCGSCYAFAPLGSIESLIKIKQDNPGYSIDLSEQFIVSCGTEWMGNYIQGCDGAYSPGPYNFITTYGTLPESCFPYVSGSGSVPPCSNKCSNWEDLIIQIDGWHTVASDITSIKNALIQHGPLTAGMIVYDDFFDYNGGVYEHPGSDPDPMNHAVVIVGYDDAQNCWICKNSWGTFWGEDGWFKILYGDCKIGQEIIYFDYVPQTGPQVNVKMHRVQMIGDIEGWLESEADWSYRVQVYTGSQWIEQSNDDYSSNEDDHTEDVTHRFHVQTPTPEITIKVWDRDLLSGDDLADVSGYTGGGTDDSTTDIRGAIFHCRYNLITDQLIQIDTIISEGGYITTSGTYQPDGGDNSDEENDAKVWFQLSDSYEPPEPNLQVNGALQGNVKIGTTHFALGTFTVENIGSDPEGFGDSYLDWAIAETPAWGNNWVFEPNSGINLPSGNPVTVSVYVDVPDEQGTFSGSVKIWNAENHADYDLISVELVAPVEKTVLQWNLFCKEFDDTLSKDILSFLRVRFLR